MQTPFVDHRESQFLRSRLSTRIRTSISSWEVQSLNNERVVSTTRTRLSLLMTRALPTRCPSLTLRCHVKQLPFCMRKQRPWYPLIVRPLFGFTPQTIIIDRSIRTTTEGSGVSRETQTQIEVSLYRPQLWNENQGTSKCGCTTTLLTR